MLFAGTLAGTKCSGEHIANGQIMHGDPAFEGTRHDLAPNIPGADRGTAEDPIGLEWILTARTISYGVSLAAMPRCGGGYPALCRPPRLETRQPFSAPMVKPAMKYRCSAK